jgi:uncharacterized protein (TIGR02284 family)
MDNEKIIEALNSLIVINNDRIEGYKTAEAEAKETDLKMMFSNFMATSLQNRKELTAEVIRLGGTAEEGTKLTGKFFRVWMDVKAAFTDNDRKAILDSCEYGESVALDLYEKVLTEGYQIPNGNLQEMLNKHHDLISADCDEIVHLRDAIIEKKME